MKKYRIENEEGVKMEFTKLKEVGDYIGCVPSTIITYMRNGRRYLGWLIVKEETKENLEKVEEKTIKYSTTINPKKYYKSKSGWKYHKYIKNEEVVCCEKTFNFSKNFRVEDFESIKTYINKGLKILIKKSDKLYDKFFIDFNSPNYKPTSQTPINCRVMTITVFVRFFDKPTFLEEIEYLDDLFTVIDRIRENYYGIRKKCGN